MWKKLCAAVTGLGLISGAAVAQNPDPDIPDVGPLTAPDPLPPEVPQLAAGYGALGAFRSSGLESDGFRGMLFATPLPPRPRQVLIPAGSTLAAPIITASGFKHGQMLFDVVPAGQEFDTITTRHPEDFVFGPASSGPEQLWVWGSAEVLIGMTRSVNVPPVVTTGPAIQGVPAAGSLGQPGTVPLFGGRQMLNDWRAGLRAEAGVYFGNTHAWGVSARLYSLFSTSEQLNGAGDGTNVVNLPQFIPAGGTVVQLPIYVGFPGVATGVVSTTAQTTYTGGDLNLRRVLRATDAWRIEALFGYRQLHLGDELGAQFTAIGTQAVAPLIGDDSIRTRNNFYGPQLGGVISTSSGRWSLQALGAVALGVTASDLDFSRTRLLAAGGGAPVPLVQTATGGHVNYFGVVAEGGLKVGFRITEHARLTMSYTGLYWSNVRRAQEQFNMSPTLTGGTTYFITHSLGWGAEVRY